MVLGFSFAGDSLGSYVAQRDDLVPYPWPFVAEKPTFPLDPRVTSTAQKRQQTIDVVILPKAVVGTVRQRFLAAPEIRHHFAEEDFGTVVVFRRR